MFGRAWTVVFVSAFALAISSRARAETTFSVDYAATGACPDRAGFLDQVQQRTQQGRLVDASEASFRFAVRAEPGGAAGQDLRPDSPGKPGEMHRGTLEIRGPGGNRSRQLTGETCVEVVSAIALVVALTLDPHASTAPVPAPPILVPIPIPVPVPGPAPPLGAPAPPLPPLIRRPPRWSHDASAPPPIGLPVLVLRESAPMAFGFGAHLVLDVGPAASPLLGGAGFLQLRSLSTPRFALRAEFGYQASWTSDIPGETLTFSLLRGRVEACAFGWMPTPWLLLWPCVDVAGGGLSAKRARENTGLTAAATSPWVGVGLDGRAEVVLHENVSLELRSGITGAFVRGAFGDGAAGVLFTPSPVGFSGGLGIASAF